MYAGSRPQSFGLSLVEDPPVSIVEKKERTVFLPRLFRSRIFTKGPQRLPHVSFRFEQGIKKFHYRKATSGRAMVIVGEGFVLRRSTRQIFDRGRGFRVRPVRRASVLFPGGGRDDKGFCGLELLQSVTDPDGLFDQVNFLHRCALPKIQFFELYPDDVRARGSIRNSR